MNARHHRQPRDRQGFSLVEMLASIVILTLGLLSLAGAMAAGTRSVSRAKQDVQYYADVQQELDSLISRGYGHVASCGTTVRGRSITWTVTSLANSQQIKLIAQHRATTDRTRVLYDTLIVYLAGSNP